MPPRPGGRARAGPPSAVRPHPGRGPNVSQDTDNRPLEMETACRRPEGWGGQAKGEGGKEGGPAMVIVPRTKEDRLGAVPLFRHCSRREMATVCRRAEVVSVLPGETLVREGQHGREFFSILEGRAAVCRGGRRVAILGPGDFFGELSLIDGEPCTATVVAVTRLEAIVLGRRDFTSLLEEVPRLRQGLLVGIVRRLRASERAAAAGEGHAPTRL